MFLVYGVHAIFLAMRDLFCPINTSRVSFQRHLLSCCLRVPGVFFFFYSVPGCYRSFVLLYRIRDCLVS